MHNAIQASYCASSIDYIHLNIKKNNILLHKTQRVQQAIARKSILLQYLMKGSIV